MTYLILYGINLYIFYALYEKLIFFSHIVV